jgi:hypothetical protein
MINRRHWRASVALVAAYALVLSALISGFAPPGQGRADPLDGLSIAICLSSGSTPTQDKAPAAPADHRHDGCCVLCMVPGLTAIDGEVRVPAPEYRILRLSLPKPPRAAGPRSAAELLPINPRAPPHLV